MTGMVCVSCILLIRILLRLPATKLPNTMDNVFIASPYRTPVFSWEIAVIDMLNIEFSTYSPGSFSGVCESPILLIADIFQKIPESPFTLPTLLEPSPSFM